MSPRPAYARRVKALQKALAKTDMGALLIHDPVNVAYLTGFHSTYCWLLYTPKESHLYTDGRYIESAKETVTGHKIHLRKPGSSNDLYDLIRATKAENVGVEPNLELSAAEAIQDALGESMDVLAAGELTTPLRRSKDAGEIAVMRKAQKAAEEVLIEALNHLSEAGPGKVSEKSFALILRLLMLDRGLEPSFPPIVAAGKMGSRPHYEPSYDVMIEKGALLIDMGVMVDGYCSDMTRMAHFGKPTAKFTRVHDAVEKAVQAAIRGVKPGAKASDVHKKAVDSLKKAKLDKYFTHGLGHGVGMNVHEAPGMNAITKDVLEVGDVVTIEPGVYMPNWGGVRIEDTVVVTKKGCDNLTNLSRKLHLL